MVMAMLMPGKQPRVEAHKGMVAIWAGKGGSDATGLVMSPAAASGAAMQMLGVVAALQGDDLPMLAPQGVAAEEALLDGGEPAVKVTFFVEGTPIALWLDLTRFAELAAGFARLSREIDGPR